jgi:hypothetical protein
VDASIHKTPPGKALVVASHASQWHKGEGDYMGVERQQVRMLLEFGVLMEAE